jgi:integrase
VNGTAPMPPRTKPKDTKHLQLKHNTWFLHYRIPKHLKNHPKFENAPAIYSQSLKTDSLKTAKRLRDSIIHKLNAGIDDPFTAWQQVIAERTEQFRADNPHLEDMGIGYQDLLIDSILTSAIKQHGVDPETELPGKLKDDQQLILDAINNRRPDTQKLLRNIANKVISEKRTLGTAPKTLYKISGAVEWFIDHLITDDIDITLIDWDQVHGFIIQDLESNLSGSTVNGHLFGLRQVWSRAKQSKLVSGDNPFSAHKVPKNYQPYDPYTWPEVYQLWEAAEEDLKLLIHSAATTGARMNELLDATVITPDGYDKPCWLFKFNSKGKTEQSTRAVPLHPSLVINPGQPFRMSDRTVSRRFKELVRDTLGEPLNQLTGKPRKLSFHSFRTTVITELTVHQRINEKVVGAVTGHLAGSAKTGSIRTYINPDDLESKYRTVSGIPWKMPR